MSDFTRSADLPQQTPEGAEQQAAANGMLTALHRQLEIMRPALLRFALLQLRNEAQAEDVVHDTLIAVLEQPYRFASQSTLRTYVTAILKHKIIDMLRHAKRVHVIEPLEDQSDDDALDALFTSQGHWQQSPRNWGDPDATLEQRDFFRTMELCLDKLPPKMARIFLMREWLDLDTDEICKELGCTSSNAWVLLYRARMRLRECLNANWFGRRLAAEAP